MNVMNQRTAAKLLAGIGIGAAAMYFLDPARGRARRNLMGDRAGATLRDSTWGLRKTGADLRNRARGVAAQMRQQFTSESPSDRQLVERVRAELGHHAGSIHNLEVTADNGVITVKGRAREIDPDDVIVVIRSVRGVADVQDQLDRGTTM